MIYIDSSAVIALLFKETNSKEIQSLFEKASQVFSSALLESEVLAAAKREKIDSSKALKFIEIVTLIFPDRSLVKEYKRIFQINYCRDAAAYHLACAFFLDPQAKNIQFVTLDSKQKEIAHKMGFLVNE